MEGHQAMGAQKSNAGAWGPEHQAGGDGKEVAGEEKPVSLLGSWFPGQDHRSPGRGKDCCISKIWYRARAPSGPSFPDQLGCLSRQNVELGLGMGWKVGDRKWRPESRAKEKLSIRPRLQTWAMVLKLNGGEIPPRTPKPALGSELVWLCQHTASGIKLSTDPRLRPQDFHRRTTNPRWKEGARGLQNLASLG